MGATTGLGLVLADLLCEPSPDPAAIAALCDAASHAERVSALAALGRREQRALYRATEGFRPLRLVDLVPAATPDAGEVRHHGRNTLPAFTRFQKRFCRAAGDDPEKPAALHGYNFQPLARLTGPGYFVARASPERAEVLIDYRQLPDTVPDAWPPVRANDRGLARVVYGGMLDTLRQVSQHVCVGSAARNGFELGSWFVLVRED